MVRPPAGAGAGEDLAQVGDPGEHRRQRLEAVVGVVGDEPGNGGLAAARRAPEQHRGKPPFGQGPAERRVACQKMVLTDHLGQGLRAQAVGKGPRRLGFKKRGHGRRALRGRAPLGIAGGLVPGLVVTLDRP